MLLTNEDSSKTSMLSVRLDVIVPICHGVVLKHTKKKRKEKDRKNKPASPACKKHTFNANFRMGNFSHSKYNYCFSHGH